LRRFHPRRDPDLWMRGSILRKLVLVRIGRGSVSIIVLGIVCSSGIASLQKRKQSGHITTQARHFLRQRLDTIRLGLLVVRGMGGRVGILVFRHGRTGGYRGLLSIVEALASSLQWIGRG
jgi:hypothetical protein